MVGELDRSASAGSMLRLESASLRLEIMPAAGGKILSLYDRRNDHEWLWSNPVIRPAPGHYGADFGRTLDSGGWDEILPAVRPTSVLLPSGRVQIPDHGDAVGLPWRVVEYDGRCARMEVEGRALPYRLSRSIELDPVVARVTMRYVLVNSGRECWPYLYCAHALLDAGRGLSIALPRREPMRVWSGHGCWSSLAGFDGDWPVVGGMGSGELDLATALRSTATLAGGALKAFVRSPRDGVVAVLATGTERCLRLVYDPAALPWLGVWINAGGWHGAGGTPYVNLGIEPATAATDDLAEAIARGEAIELAPGGCAEWKIMVEAS